MGGFVFGSSPISRALAGVPYRAEKCGRKEQEGKRGGGVKDPAEEESRWISEVPPPPSDKNKTD